MLRATSKAKILCFNKKEINTRYGTFFMSLVWSSKFLSYINLTGIENVYWQYIGDANNIISVIFAVCILETKT